MIGCLNGGAVVSNNTSGLPQVQLFVIGALGTLQRFNGHIRKLRYYPKALPSQLQSMTA
jgi:hypothetical protein